MNEIADSMPLFRSSKLVALPKSPKEFELLTCKPQKACQLNALWHSRFPQIDWSNVVRNQDCVCYVADYDAVAYAVAIWSSPVAANRLSEGKTALELRRLAISDDCPKNTASWMISKMKKDIKRRFPHITILISYQDTDVHSGTIYKASGWIDASRCKGMSWTNNERRRNKEQSLAEKVRWEFRVRKKPCFDHPTDDLDQQEKQTILPL